ncbi:acyl-CoA dehydrogenase family protein [Burkholderia sp. AU19243]|uniref:acyl-CoA dehydrogenase family protein n=1 Tax=Burkholderia sp. AU19243 TaxID=2824810 RepID=UPI001B9D7D08|nr:acyl-CoA dehydrogenase [Burkholderia sp. AU19243]MBR8146428.1 acyl-CoA dehydrogenase family protein [Burkholderia vietnamiensis]MBR8366767.1 acyl-CoA dehydrogenase family protein [Burkholderia sp. AU19243]
MDFGFTDEQQQFADALRRYLGEQYGFDARQAIVRSDAGVSDVQWSAFAELGLTALPVPDAHGGFGGGTVDMLVAMQELGRALVVEPYWATAVGIEALRVAGSGTGDDAALLEAVAQGQKRLAVAFHEPRARYDLYEIDTRAREDGGTHRLTGTKSIVQHGAQAHAWIVPARVDGGGIGLFVVERDAAGVKLADYRTIDGQRAATIELHETPARQLTGGARDAAALEQIADYATFLLCAEAVGALDELNRATVEYTKTREQFGVPIARFQALQHRMVDMLIHAEQARSLTYLAAVRYAGGDAGARRKAVSAAKARVGAAARFVGQQAVQLHGGMGVTNEVAAAHLFKRLSIIEITLGDTDHHLARIAALPDFAQFDAA